jgi:A/G-specific adenine glycosylase
MTGQKLITWYEVNKRHLPWRDVANPYLIWVSEIILQQTRVAQGLDYYHRFVEAYPDIFSLARADIDEILKIWQGLGYYSRARNMHFAAKHIVEVYQGKFPETYDGLITIKGIGDYTASAIASFAFGQAVPVIDGNVNRVIARLHGVQQPVDKPSGRQLIRAHAENMMTRNIPGTYNQAIMEFGALQCVPKNPDCNNCIFNRICIAFQCGIANKLPVKEKAAMTTTRYLHYIYVCFGENTFIHRRAEGDIWTGLYEFPMIETATETELDELSRLTEWQSYFDGQTPVVETISPMVTHRLTHRILKIRFYKINVNQPIYGEDLIEIAVNDIYRYAVPKVIENYIMYDSRFSLSIKKY